jgi:hypothetical protein
MMPIVRKITPVASSLGLSLFVLGVVILVFPSLIIGHEKTSDPVNYDQAALKSIENNLRLLESAKVEWGIENLKSEIDYVGRDFTHYLEDHVLPSTRLGETYTIGKVEDLIRATLPEGRTLNGQSEFTITNF